MFYFVLFRSFLLFFQKNIDFSDKIRYNKIEYLCLLARLARAADKNVRGESFG